MELFVVNQSNVDRLIRAAIAVVLIIAYFLVDSSLTMVLLAIAGALSVSYTHLTLPTIYSV